MVDADTLRKLQLFFDGDDHEASFAERHVGAVFAARAEYIVSGAQNMIALVSRFHLVS